MEELNNGNNIPESNNNFENRQQYYQMPPVKQVKTVPLDKKDSVFFIIIAVLTFCDLLLGVFCELSLGFSLFSVLFTVASYFYVYKKNNGLRIYSKLTLILSVLLEISFVFNDDTAVKIIDILAIGFLYIIFTADECGSLTCKDGKYMSLFEPIINAITRTIDNFTLPANSLKKAEKEGSKSAVIRIALGLLIAIPLLAVILPLLIESDIAFSSLISKLFEDVSTVIVSLLISALVFPFVFIYLFAERKCGAENNKAFNSKQGNISPATLNTVLFCVCAAYVIYLISQLAYISDAFAFILPDNYTKAQFARSGFFEMSIIAFINVLIIGLTGNLVKHNEKGNLLIFTKILLVFITVFSQFYIITAFIKMAQYISAFGLTRLRVLTSVFMIMLFVIFTVILLSLFVKKIPYGKAIIIIAAFTLLSVSICDINNVIAEHNYERYAADGKELDLNEYSELGVSGYLQLYEIVKTGDEKYSSKAEYILLEDAQSRFDFNDENYDIKNRSIYDIFRFNTTKSKALKIVAELHNTYTEEDIDEIYNKHFDYEYAADGIYEFLPYDSVLEQSITYDNFGEINICYNKYTFNEAEFEFSDYDYCMAKVNDENIADFKKSLSQFENLAAESDIILKAYDFDESILSENDYFGKNYYTHDNFENLQFVLYDAETGVIYYFKIDRNF